MMRRVAKTGTLLVTLSLLCGGCVTPVIPLPPPETDNMMLADQSCDATNKTIKFQGNDKFTSPFMYVFVWNTHKDRQKGVVLYSNGKGGFAPVKDFSAVDGDEIWIWTKAALHEENKSDTLAVTVDCTKTKGTGNGFVSKP